MGLFTPYILEEWKEPIRNYKYKGSDLSILYRYFTSPFCNYVVNYLPDNLAPNIVK